MDGFSPAQLRQFSLADTVDQHRDPSNEAETMLRSIWSRILGIEEASISVDENFFRLGGDSISATRLANLATKTYGIPISALAVMTHKTISRLAALVERSSHLSSSDGLSSDGGVNDSSFDDGAVNDMSTNDRQIFSPAFSSFSSLPRPPALHSPSRSMRTTRLKKRTKWLNT